MTDAVSRWREFEALLHDRGLAWGLRYAPADLRWARRARHRFGSRTEHLLPADYLEFVAEVGYPVVGFGYYDTEGISFLPPQAMSSLSHDVHDRVHGFPPAVEDGPTVCRHAFFAGYDLSDINGFAFAEDGVWLVEDSTAIEQPASGFTEWMLSEIGRLEERVADLDDDDVAELLADSDGEDDPHRLLDYSLGGTYDQAPYSAADLELNWAEEQSGSPYTYGLIDADGRWRIPLGKNFISVRPFRDGVAEVIANDERSDYGGPWRRIDLDGRFLAGDGPKAGSPRE